jgi:1-deoxy-D-xylulose 5-phosphate reductoisomerase
MRHISILGSTGSIGTQTLDVARANGDIRVEALAAHGNIALLEAQIREFHPRTVCVYDETKAAELKTKVADTKTRICAGHEGLLEVATEAKAETLVTGIVGMIGIEPTVAAIREGKNIALANKETLVCAGHLIMPLAAREGVKILPVDSEHSAIFQCLRGNKKNRIRKILLTASGGPFRGYTRKQLEKVTLKDALRHPTWNMGHKVTIDSSTMVNKGLELIEARWLFDVEVDDIEVLVQPQSILHSAVEFMDGAVMAELGTPDMKLPIQYALYYPKRRKLSGSERLNLAALGKLDFSAPDFEAFPGLKLAYHAGRTGGSLPTVFNAANEAAVRAFLNGKIRYLEIAACIADAMEHHEKVGILALPTVSDILALQKTTEQWLAARYHLD